MGAQFELGVDLLLGVLLDPDEQDRRVVHIARDVREKAEGDAVVVAAVGVEPRNASGEGEAHGIARLVEAEGETHGITGRRVDERIEGLHLQVVTQVVAGAEPFLRDGKTRREPVEADLELPETQAAVRGGRIGGLHGVDPHRRAVTGPGPRGPDAADVIPRLPLRKILHRVVELGLGLGLELRVTDGRIVGHLPADGRGPGADGARRFETDEFCQLYEVLIRGGRTRIDHGNRRKASSVGVADPSQAAVRDVKLPVSKHPRVRLPLELGRKDPILLRKNHST